jgi:hypothetical protein
MGRFTMKAKVRPLFIGAGCFENSRIQSYSPDARIWPEHERLVKARQMRGHRLYGLPEERRR